MQSSAAAPHKYPPVPGHTHYLKKKRKNGSVFLVIFLFTTIVYIYSTFDPSFIHYFSAVKQV